MPGATSHIQRLLQQAIDAQQTGDLAAAVSLCKQVLDNDPDNTAAHYYLGVALHQNGDNLGAIPHLQRATELAPDRAELWANLGVAHHHLKQYAQALKSYRQALAADADYLEAWFNLGVAQQETGAYAEAARMFAEVTARDPRHTNAVRRHANCLLNLKQNEQAIALLRTHLDDTPDDVESALVLSQLLSEKQAWSLAIEVLSDALLTLPDQPELLNALGMMHTFMEQFDEAEMVLRRALETEPGSIEALSNLGSVLAMQEKYHEAEHCFERALAISPEHAATLDNYGTSLTARGEFERGTEFHRRAITLQPDNATFHYNLAINRLRAGDYAAGLAEHEWRLRKPSGLKWGRVWRDRFPAWQGETLEDELLLIYREQGIGDEVFFLGYIDGALARCARAALDCDPRLHPLLTRVHPQIQFIDPEQPLSKQHNARHCALGSLMYYTQSDLAAPRTTPYLQPDPEKVAQWRDELAELGPGRKIGISWHGGAITLERERRSIPLGDWAPALTTPNCNFIDVQYDDREKARRQAEQKFGITIHRYADMDAMTDLDGFAALLGALDLLITVDNSTAHLAGALGVPTRLLLPRLSDWRWRTITPACTAYPSITVFRKHDQETWRSCIERMWQAESN